MGLRNQEALDPNAIQQIHVTRNLKHDVIQCFSFLNRWDTLFWIFDKELQMFVILFHNCRFI